MCSPGGVGRDCEAHAHGGHDKPSLLAHHEQLPGGGLVSSWHSFAGFGFSEKVRCLGFISKQFIMCCLALHCSAWWIVVLTVVPVSILLIRYFRTRRSCISFSIKAACLLLIWGLPHAYVLYMVNYQGGRIAPAEPLAYACLWGMALRPTRFGRRRFLVIYALSLFLLVKASYEATALAWKERIEYEQQCGELRSLYHAAQSEAAARGLDYGAYEVVVVSAPHMKQESIS